jgi:hypothetical protein
MTAPLLDRASPRPRGDEPPRLDFAVRGATVDAAAATPSIALDLAIAAPPDVVVRSVVLRAQVRIDARRRSYDDATRARLREVFGAPDQWGASVRSLPWTQVVACVPPFRGETALALPVACTYDFEVVASKVLHGLRDGAIPLALLFSGTVFWADATGALRTAMLPWEDEVRYELPVALWREAMDRFFPGQAWLRVDRATFDRLVAWRAQRCLPSWDVALDALLDGTEMPP